jgi:hypothetical protein
MIKQMGEGRLVKSARTALTAIVICVAASTGAFALYKYYTSLQSSDPQADELPQIEDREHFIAKFDSLKETCLYPAAAQTGAFTKSRFDENREEWTLRVDSEEWQGRPEVSRKEILTGLYNRFRDARAQAGGDPQAAKLIVVNEAGEGLYTCVSPETADLERPIKMRSIVELVILALCVALPVAALLFFGRRRKEIALVILSLLVSILMIELFLKHFYPQFHEHDKMFEHDPKLGWKFVPNKRGAFRYTNDQYHYIETNSLGFRDGPPPSDQDDITKILVLGDSFVSNVTVEDNEVFTEIMERQLENTAVLNFGVNGYGQAQECLLLQEWFPKINPDIVILVIYIRNDFDDNMGGDWLYPRPVTRWDKDYLELTIDPPPPAHALEERIYERVLAFCKKSHFYSLLSKRLDVLVEKYTREEGSEYERSLRTPPELYLCRKLRTKTTRLLYRTMEVLLLTIAHYVQQQNVPIVFVIAPSFVQVDSDLWSSTLQEFDEEPKNYSRSLPNRRLMQFAKRNSLSMVDLLPILEAELGNGKETYNREQQHWNSEGNRAVADALLDYLKTAALVDTLHK